MGIRKKKSTQYKVSRFSRTKIVGQNIKNAIQGRNVYQKYGYYQKNRVVPLLVPIIIYTKNAIKIGTMVSTKQWFNDWYKYYNLDWYQY